MSLMVSVSGIRGIVGKDLSPPVIMNFVSAFLRLIENKGRNILIGRDTRESGTFIDKIVKGTIISLGFDVIDIGIATTPTVLLMTRKLHCAGGIAITASHNPLEWNALKFCDSQGIFLKEEHINELKRLTESQEQNWRQFDSLGSIRTEKEANIIHTNEVLKNIDYKLIKSKRFKVAIDPGGGAGSVIDRTFLEKLGCAVFSINTVSSGQTVKISFPRGAEPVPEHLRGLCELVQKTNADIGFAQDPDGDRLAVVSESGVPIGEEYTLVLAGKAFLNRKKTDIVCNLSTSMMINDLAKRHGVRVHRTKIGEIHVTKKLLKERFLFGGEGNGGVIVPEINPCRDSIVAMGFILELLAVSAKTVSQLVNAFPSYVFKKEKMTYSKMNNDALTDILHQKAKKYFLDYSINLLDGIKIYTNLEWLHLRPSNTEPVIRIFAEAEKKQRTEELIEIGKSIVNEV
jgi:phosphomannomutase